MANWARDFIERNPELARWPVHRHRHALSFESPSGERYSYFVGSPAHWFDRAEGWREIDTTLRRQPDGGFAAPGLPVCVYPDGTSTCGGYAQRSGRVGVLSGGDHIGSPPRFRPLATLGPGRVDGDCLIREAPGFRHVVRVTETGLREELHVERGISGAAEDLLTVETQARGRLPDGYRFGRPVADVDGVSLPLTQRGGWVGLPLRWARAGTVLDPDYAAETDDGYIYGYDGGHNCAAARATAYAVQVGTYPYLRVGQWHTSTSFYIYRSFLKFATAGIPDADIISQVNLKLCVPALADNSATDFDVLIIKQDWSATDPITTANKEGPFDDCLAGTADNSIWLNTVNISTNNLQTSGNLSTSWPNKTGSTYYSLLSSRDLNANEPSAMELIDIASQNNSTAGYRPLLAVTHAAARYRRMLLGVGV
jgi:hypothetical protein